MHAGAAPFEPVLVRSSCDLFSVPDSTTESKRAPLFEGDPYMYAVYALYLLIWNSSCPPIPDDSALWSTSSTFTLI
jgi:hypothetical protein